MTQMDVRSFGDALIETRDLDPVYCGLVGAALPEPQLCRWLLTYLCFYHVGSASWLSELEGEDFWANMTDAALNQVAAPVGGRWPRAAERRHFRGDKCVRAVEQLSKRFPEPETAVRCLVLCATAKEVMNQVQSWPMFGSWVSFKAADLVERVAGGSCQIGSDVVLLYDAPREALELMDMPWDRLLLHFSQKMAPPTGDRACGPAECETIACKYGSYVGGHYHIGKDIAEQRHALLGWGRTAEKIVASYPEMVR